MEGGNSGDRENRSEERNSYVRVRVAVRPHTLLYGVMAAVNCWRRLIRAVELVVRVGVFCWVRTFVCVLACGGRG